MITRLRFENYRSHGATEFPLQPITLFIGSTASGKSNVFKGLSFIQNSVRRQIHNYFGLGRGEFRQVRSQWAGESDPIGFEVELNGFKDQPDVSATYRLRLADSSEGLYVLEESLSRRHGDSPPESVFLREAMTPRPMGEFGEVGPYDPTLLYQARQCQDESNPCSPSKSFAKQVASQLVSLGYYHLFISKMNSLDQDPFPNLIGKHGENLPRFLLSAKKEDPQRYNQILSSMQELLPELESIEVDGEIPGSPGIAMKFRGHEGSIAAPDLSDGTLLSLGLLCIALVPSPPSLLCIEEPEAGIHPGRLRSLFEEFITLAYPDEGVEPTQVLFSTHSPWLIDFFDEMPESVLLVEQKNGRSKVKRLVDVRRDSLHETLFNGPIGHLWATGVYEGL